jgi:hypothetical protein
MAKSSWQSSCVSSPRSISTRRQRGKSDWQMQLRMRASQLVFME